MNRTRVSIRRTTTAALVAVLLSAVPIAATAQPEDREQGPRSTPGESGAAVYIVDGRVIAIRRDPLPVGAYGGQGVDYSPDMKAWVLDSRCAQ